MFRPLWSRAVVSKALLVLVAYVIEQCEGEAGAGVSAVEVTARRPGHPRAETVRVVATLRRFLREGTPWRGLRASDEEASGSTLRRWLARWAEHNILGRAHRLAVSLLRRPGHDLLVDSSSVRAKRGGDLTGPNPTDRGKKGTKYHLAVTRGGIPVACAATGANVNDTTLFASLFRVAVLVLGRLRTAYADRGYDAEAHRALCRAHQVRPCIAKQNTKHGSGLGKKRWPVERTHAWLLENKRLGLRYDRKGFIVEALLATACLLMVVPHLAREL